MATQQTKQHSSNHGVAEEHEGHISKRTYFIVFAALMILMGLTVGVYYGEDYLETQGIVLPGVVVVGIAMSIAIAKTALIVLFFMHVKVGSKMTKIFAAAAFLWLFLLFGITMGDYLARDWPGPVDGPLTLVRTLL